MDTSLHTPASSISEQISKSVPGREKRRNWQGSPSIATLLLGILVLIQVATIETSVAAPPPGLYWTDNTTDRVRLNGLDGLGGSDLITSEILNPQQISITDTRLYYADSNGGKIVRANHDGSDVRVIHSDLSLPVGVFVAKIPGTDNEKIFWSELGPPGVIRSSNLNGSGIVTHATGLSFPQGIAVTDLHIYWADLLTKKIQRVLRTGGTVEDLITQADGLDDPNSVTVDGEFLYWGDSGTRKIQRATLEGESITDILTADDGLSFPRGLSVAGDFIYWADGIQDKIGRARLDGSSVTDILTNVGAQYLVAVPPEPAIGVFMTGAGGGGIRYRVERVGLDNKNRERLYDVSGAHTRGLELTDFHVYWSDSLQSRIFRSNFDGTDLIVVHAQLPERPDALAITDSHIYWTSFDSLNIHRMNLDGTSLAVVQSGDGARPGDLAVHRGKLYWSETRSFGKSLIRRWNTDGGEAVDLVSTFDQAQIDVSDQGIFYTDHDGIWRAELDGGSPRIIVDSTPGSIVVTETHVFWSEKSAIYSARHDGDGRRFVATAQSATSIEASHPPSVPGVYWARAGGNGASSIRRSNFDGSEVVDVITGLSNIRDVAVDDFFLFWTELSGGDGVAPNIGRAYHDGSHVERIVLTGSNSELHFLCTNGSRVFWSNTAQGIVESVDLDGSERKISVSGLTRPLGVAATNNHLYVAHRPGTITRTNLAGLNPVELLASLAFPIDVEVSDRHLYWLGGSSNGSKMVMRANLDGSGPSELVSNLEDPFGIAVSQGHVYWTDATEDRVRMRVPKGHVSDVFEDPDGLHTFGIDVYGKPVLPTPVITSFVLSPTQTQIVVRVDNYPASGGTLSLFRNSGLSDGKWLQIQGTSILPVFQKPHTYLMRFNETVRPGVDYYRVVFRSLP